MRKRLFVPLLLVFLPVVASAQWSSTPPGITVAADVAQIRQFDGGSAVNLSFGTDGVTPGIAKTVTPEQNNPASGVGAKVNIRFNTGTKVTASGSALTAVINATTFTINPTYTCAVADDQAGTNMAAFAGTCEAGHEWGNSTITGMQFRSVLVGGTIAGSETETLPAGTYTGTIVVTLSASSS